MGQQSSRVEDIADAHRVTIEKLQHDAFNVVRVTDDLLQYLRGYRDPNSAGSVGGSGPTAGGSVDAERLIDRAAMAERRYAEERALTRRLQSDLEREKQRVANLKEDVSKKSQVMPPAPTSSGAPSSWFSSKSRRETSSAALEGREATLRAQEARLSELLGSVDVLQNVMQKTLSEETTKTAQRVAIDTCPTACATLESEVLTCMLKNKERALECKGVAEKFKQCVEGARAGRLGMEPKD